MMLKLKSIIFITALFSSNYAFAAGGFTWLSSIAHAIHVEEHVVTFAFVGIIMMVMGLLYRSSVSSAGNALIPDSRISIRNILDAIGGNIYTQCKTIIGEKEGPKYFTFLCCIFMFILMNNLIGIIPGFLPPTENLNTTLALGVLAFVYFNVVGCKEAGTINYLKHFAGPLWYMAVLIFPIEIISTAVRPLSLALRLRGNMYGDHLILGIFSDLVPYLVPIIFLILGMLVSLIQAYVFTILTMVYVGLAVAHHDHDEEHAH